MLDTDTKRRIDTARDILVGKVPDPKSQVEQITIALIYKFMDDMDVEAEELGGKRKFFTGEFARYGWGKVMSSELGGHAMRDLYEEALKRMPENDKLPPLFRKILEDASLPYRDPETLKSFLKIINEFSYDHSERLGDAFEYLLSVLGSQGDAGQFRTPRHIIDFMVEILAPQKGETVLDPACGTAGFLISAYKHILRSNTTPSPLAPPPRKGEGKRAPSPLAGEGWGEGAITRVVSTLTPEEKGQLAQNFKGYDISPDMVRLSLVNLYLHGFTDPHIVEYDTLTSEERWNEYADVILANPPFMSPKGGIKPHKRFSIQAKRSEVLFVDYMAEHLTPTGRAGIIVPEGIIFQSQTAYKELRKMLVENSLVAVISLPAGCFNPYSGVKTSILILDKSIARQSDTVVFFKVENDGYGLGAQRRANAGEQLTQVQAELAEYLQALRSHQPTDNLQPTLGLIVAKEKIAANGDYNLSGERYREGDDDTSMWPIVPLGESVDFISGYAFKSTDMAATPLDVTYRPVVKIGNVGRDGQLDMAGAQFHAYSDDLGRFVLRVGDVVMAMTGATVGKVAVVKEDGFLLNQRVGVLRVKPTALQSYVLHMLCSAAFYDFCQRTAGGGAQGNIAPREILGYPIPLPPLEVQKEIVAEIEGYQKEIKRLKTEIMEQEKNIQKALACVWDDDEPDVTGT